VKRLLVGVDGSEAAAAALGWAGRLAARIDAEVIVAHVFRAEQAEVSADDYEELARDAERRLGAEWSGPLQGTDVAHRGLLLTGAPDALIEAAVREDVDLLVVGPRGRGGFAGLHMGSLAHHLTHYTRRPLGIVPEPGAGSALDRIVVGVDGSEGSVAALDWCAGLAGAAKVEVIAVYAFEPFAEWVLESDPHSWRQTAEDKMETEWVVPLRAAGVSVRTRVIRDIHPVAALAAAADEEDAGLVVVGTRGLSGVVGLRLGRVPIQLVHHTQLPVVLVPPVDHRGAF